MAESSWSRRHLGVGTVALCVLLAVLGGGAWVTWTAARWLADQADAVSTDPAVAQALDRLNADARAFAGALLQAATVSDLTPEQIRSAADESDLTVATIGRSAGELRVWVAGVERRVPSEGATEDVWLCFAVIIADPGTAQARAEVSHPEYGCPDQGNPQALAYATAWLEQRDALARYGHRLASTTEPSPDAGSVVDGVRILSSRVEGSTVTVDATDEAGTIVLGTRDAYLYGLRLTAGPTIAGGSRITPVLFPVELDEATRTRATADAALLIRTAPGLTSPGPPGVDVSVILNRGPLVSTVRYETVENGVTEHVAVRVVAGGGYGAIPNKPPVLVCYAIVRGIATGTISVHPEPCAYPLVLPG